MGRPLRLFEPESVYFVTGRCLQARFLLRPSQETNSLVGAVLARAISVFDVDVFAFVFLANHFHMLIRSRHGRIPAFMQYLRSNIAKKVGRAVDWHGKFWDRRYDAAPVLDDDALVDRLRYILAHGVKEGLIARCEDWPGVTCIPELTTATPRLFPWPAKVKLPQRDETKRGTATIRLAALPCWETMGADHRRKHVASLVRDIEAEVQLGRCGVPVLGVRRILDQNPHARPRHAKASPRPLCHASTYKAKQAYAAKYCTFVDAYRRASTAFRGGNLGVEFPEYAYRPPWIVPYLLAA